MSFKSAQQYFNSGDLLYKSAQNNKEEQYIILLEAIINFRKAITCLNNCNNKMAPNYINLNRQVLDTLDACSSILFKADEATIPNYKYIKEHKPLEIQAEYHYQYAIRYHNRYLPEQTLAHLKEAVELNPNETCYSDLLKQLSPASNSPSGDKYPPEQILAHLKEAEKPNLSETYYSDFLKQPSPAPVSPGNSSYLPYVFGAWNKLYQYGLGFFTAINHTITTQPAQDNSTPKSFKTLENS